MPSIFFLSPARTTGPRAQMLFNPAAQFPLALRLQRGEAIPIGETFSFLSGLYFRGKMAYINQFAKKGCTYVITSNQGLLPVDTPFTLSELQTLSEAKIDLKDQAYRRALEIDLASWARKKNPQFILLGSIASPKYTGILTEFLGDRLYIPTAFRGKGDMSRGSLMLKAAASGEELAYERLGKEVGN